MAGINLTPQRRSQLLELLLSQQARPRRNPQTGLEAALRLGAQGVRQKGIRGLQEREAAATKTQGGRTTAIVNALQGKPATDFQGRTITDQSGAPQGPADLNALLGQALGINPQDPAANAVLAGQINQAFTPEKEAKAPTTRTVRDGEDVVQQQWVPAKRKWEEVGRGTKGSGVNIFTGDPPVDEKKINTDAVQSFNASGKLRRNLFSTVPEVNKKRGAVGTRGRIGTVTGGIVSNVLGPEVGNTVANAISGSNQGEIAEITTRLSTLRTDLLPVITGEESGRFTEPERELAGRAVQLIDEIKDFGSLGQNFPQLQGTLRELMIVTLESQFESARASNAVTAPVDLSSRDDVDLLVKELRASGFDDEDVRRTLGRLARIESGR